MKLYPIMADLESKPVVIIGGGNTALRKIKDLIETGAQIKIISPHIHEEIARLAKGSSGKVKIIKREYREKDIENAFMIFAAANDPEVNSAVYNEAKKKNILINTADDPENCSFIIPSFTRRGKLLLSVSTSGASPAYSAKLRRDLEKHLPHDIEYILESLAKAREILKSRPEFSALNSSQRGEILKHIAGSRSALEEITNYCSNEVETAVFLKSILNRIG